MGVDYGVIGHRIKCRRKSLKKTQEDVAEALLVSVGYISQIERGVTKISLDTLSEIAVFLECDLTEFITGVTPAQNCYLENEMEKVLADMDDTQKNMLLEIADILKKY